jgi:hypothetical protein
MLKKILLTFIAILTLINPVFAESKNSQGEIWNSDSGLSKLQNSKFNNDFYQLVNFYQPQENPLFCSIASATIIKNALNYGKIPSQKTGEIQSSDKKLISYKLYSQKDFFNSKTEEIKKRSIIEYQELADPGINLDDYRKMLEDAHDLSAKSFHVIKNNSEEIEKFRQVLKSNLSEKNYFIVANFDGKILGKETRGHFSPIVAYDEKSDSVLVMDVALHKNQWYWIDLSKLFEAMNTKDGLYYRGYLIIGH